MTSEEYNFKTDDNSMPFDLMQWGFLLHNLALTLEATLLLSKGAL